MHLGALLVLYLGTLWMPLLEESLYAYPRLIRCGGGFVLWRRGQLSRRSSIQGDEISCIRDHLKSPGVESEINSRLLFTVKSDQIINSILVQTTQSSLVLQYSTKMDSILISGPPMERPETSGVSRASVFLILRLARKLILFEQKTNT